MFRLLPILLSIVCFALLSADLAAQPLPNDTPGVGPLDLRFHRQAVRRFVFAQEIPLGGLFPGQIFGFDRTNPVFDIPGKSPCRFVERGGVLEIQPSPDGQPGDAAVWVSGINPYATYIADVQSLPAGAELRMEFGTLPQTFDKDETSSSPDKVEVVLQPDAASFPTVRIVKAGEVAREHAFPDGKRVEAPFEFFVQPFSGRFLKPVDWTTLEGSAERSSTEGRFQFLWYACVSPRNSTTDCVPFQSGFSFSPNDWI